MFAEFFTPEQIAIVTQIILIDLVLAGDNAIIIGMVASKFPVEQRKKVIFWGIGGAVILRIILTLLTAYLLQITGLRLIGGLLLLYIVYKLYVDVIKGSETEEDVKVDNSSFLKAIWTVLLADFTMSLDNVLGVAGAAGDHYGLLVSGTAMGLIKEGKEVRILTDIQGIEDFLGDMDFKVAGTDKGITALQMDMKITGLPVSIISDAIKKARPARLHILEKMQEAIDKPQESLSPHAPRLLSFRIDPELIGTVIGPGGRTIKGITERTNTKIDIEDGGIVTIASHDGAAAEEAQRIIEGLTRKVHEGEIFSGVVTRIIPIGAFVEILPGKEGMVHISQLSEARVERVEDVVRQGDEVTVRVREIDSRGRINLTLRGVGQNNGMSYPQPTPTPVAPLN